MGVEEYARRKYQ